MNPRPLGYEPYDARLPRPGLSPADAVTSVDRTDPVSIRRLRLPRLKLSRRVRFTNRFTKQAVDLQFLYPFRRGRGPLSLPHRTDCCRPIHRKGAVRQECDHGGLPDHHHTPSAAHISEHASYTPSVSRLDMRPGCHETGSTSSAPQTPTFTRKG